MSFTLALLQRGYTFYLQSLYKRPPRGAELTLNLYWFIYANRFAPTLKSGYYNFRWYCIQLIK